MRRKYRTLVVLTLVAGLVWPTGVARAQQAKDPLVDIVGEGLAKYLRSLPLTPEAALKDRAQQLAEITPTLESLSPECRRRCEAVYQHVVDTIERRYQALLALGEAVQERINSYQGTPLSIPRINKAFSRLERATREFDARSADVRAARREYEECLQDCADEGGGIGTGGKVAIGTAILGGIGLGIAKGTQGGDGGGSTPAGGTPSGGGQRSGTVTVTSVLGAENYQGQGPSGVDGTYRGAVQRTGSNCPDSVVFPPALDISAVAAGFGSGGGTGTFSGTVSGQLFNGSFTGNFQSTRTTVRYVLTVRSTNPPCDLVFEGTLPRQ